MVKIQKVFGEGNNAVVFGEWSEIEAALQKNEEKVTDYVIESDDEIQVYHY